MGQVETLHVGGSGFVVKVGQKSGAIDISRPDRKLFNERLAVHKYNGTFPSRSEREIQMEVQVNVSILFVLLPWLKTLPLALRLIP